MSKRPVNLTIHERVLDAAEDLMKRRGYSSLSTLVEELVRDEYEKRFGPIELKEGPAAEATGNVREVHYGSRRGPRPKKTEKLSPEQVAAAAAKRAIAAGESKEVSSSKHHPTDAEARRMRDHGTGRSDH